MSDRELIRTIIYNLLSNAVKYSLPGGEISVRVSGEEPPFITVHDNGQGIAPEDIEHIFERFLPAPTNRAAEIRGARDWGLPLQRKARVLSARSLPLKAARDSLPNLP